MSQETTVWVARDYGSYSIWENEPVLRGLEWTGAIAAHDTPEDSIVENLCTSMFELMTGVELTPYRCKQYRWTSPLSEMPQEVQA